MMFGKDYRLSGASRPGAMWFGARLSGAAPSGARLSGAISICLMAVLLTGCKTKSAEARAVATGADPNEISLTPGLSKNLHFGTPQMMEFSGTLQVAAHVDTDARNIARVGSPVSGRIVKLLIFEGQHVRAGSVLAMLHSTDLSDTQFALIRASSQENVAAAAVKRAELLLDADVIGRAELERRKAEQLQVAAEAASYRTQLRGLGMNDAQIGSVEKNRRLSAEYPILAPKSGTVLKRDVTIGQVVQPADPAFVIADLSSVWIVANVPEEDAGALKPGIAVTVTVAALEGSRIAGKLAYVSPIVDPATRTVEVRMDVVNQGALLKPDQLATMMFNGHSERKLGIPNAAVVRENNKDCVFVQTAGQKYMLHEVSLGDEENDNRVVVSGLTADDHIVTDGAFHLNNQRKQNAVKGNG